VLAVTPRGYSISCCDQTPEDSHCSQTETGVCRTLIELNDTIALSFNSFVSFRSANLCGPKQFELLRSLTNGLLHSAEPEIGVSCMLD
jgi:hypothetical protein